MTELLTLSLCYVPTEGELKHKIETHSFLLALTEDHAHVTIHKMDFNHNYHLSIIIREGISKILNRKVILKMIPFRGKKLDCLKVELRTLPVVRKTSHGAVWQRPGLQQSAHGLQLTGRRRTKRVMNTYIKRQNTCKGEPGYSAKETYFATYICNLVLLVMTQSSWP